MPNWVGDVVLATPALRAMRSHFAESRITYLLKPYVNDLVAGSPWMDDVITWRGRRGKEAKRGFLRTVGTLRRADYDLAVLLSNSFRSALLASTAGITTRLGYDRDGRGILLTDRLVAPRESGKYVPTSMVAYYNALVAYLGCEPGMKLELHTEAADEAELDARLADCEPPGDGPLVIINPGAAFGSAKCWLPERFAEVGQRLIEERDASVLISCAPSEREMAGAISQLIRQPHVLLDDPVVSLRLLKALIRRSDLLVTNDTGPRHFAVAFDVPAVTIFGPTHPEWTETGYTNERKVLVEVDCGPCMKRVCPLDHRCMTQITADAVVAASSELLDARVAEGACG